VTIRPLTSHERGTIMALTIRRAERRKARLRLGISGPAGSGKTLSSLLIAQGLGGKKIGIIDTEHGSADLYADRFEYDVLTLDPPYEPERYLEALHAFESEGYDIIIIDSLSHEWNGEGGVLETIDRLTEGRKNIQAWAKVTPRHNALVNGILQSPAHVIATVRSKTQWEITTVSRNGRDQNQVTKLGLGPVQREGLDYEFTVFFDLAVSHVAEATKDRTGLFDCKPFTPSPATGKQLLEWLESGKAAGELAAPVAIVEGNDALVARVVEACRARQMTGKQVAALCEGVGHPGAELDHFARASRAALENILAALAPPEEDVPPTEEPAAEGEPAQAAFA